MVASIELNRRHRSSPPCAASTASSKPVMTNSLSPIQWPPDPGAACGNESRRPTVEQRMKLNDAARALIGEGTDATLVTLNPDGSPQVTVVWMALESTPDGDELVSAHLAEYQKTRNIRRDPRVAVTILSIKHPNVQTPYLAITGTARIVEGGAPALLKKLAKVMLG